MRRSSAARPSIACSCDSLKMTCARRGGAGQSAPSRPVVTTLDDQAAQYCVTYCLTCGSRSRCSRYGAYTTPSTTASSTSPWVPSRSGTLIDVGNGFFTAAFSATGSAGGLSCCGGGASAILLLLDLIFTGFNEPSDPVEPVEDLPVLPDGQVLEPLLRVLQESDQQERHDRRVCVDDQLVRVDVLDHEDHRRPDHDRQHAAGEEPGLRDLTGHDVGEPVEHGGPPQRSAGCGGSGRFSRVRAAAPSAPVFRPWQFCRDRPSR